MQIARGLFGDLAADAMARIASIEGTLELRRKQLASAIETGSDKADALSARRRLGWRPTSAASGIRGRRRWQQQGTSIALTGLAILIVAKLVQATVANFALEARFTEWTSDRSIRSGLPVPHIVFAALFMAAITIAAMVHYSFPGQVSPS